MSDDLKPDAGKADAVGEKVEPTETADHGATIERWFRDHFAGTALGATTDLYNAAFKAKEDLKKRLGV